MAPLRLTRAAALLLAVGLVPVGAAAQGGGAADTVPAPPRPAGETLPEDTAAVADTSRADTAPPALPPLPERPGAARERTVAWSRSWGRDDLLESTALSLQDFLLDRAPGVLPLRSGFYFGPHQVADGPWGAGAVRVEVDGRQLHSLASGQPDLSRISLASVDRLRLVRRAGETVVEVRTLSHDEEEAYSRISALTGQPGADGLRAIFTNRAGDDFTVHAAVDHLNVGLGRMPGSRFDAWAKLGWRPGRGDTGFELVWQSESVTRTLGEATSELSRDQLMIHGRTQLAPGLQAEAWAGRTSRDPSPAFFSGPSGPDTALAGTADRGSNFVDQFLGRVAYREGPLGLRVSGGHLVGRSVPRLTGDARGSLRLGPLDVEAGVEASSWPEVATLSWRAGLAYRPDWLEGVTVRAEAAGGDRAVPRPGRTVTDSLVQSFDAVSLGADLELGRYRISGTVGRRTAGRQLPFGGSFDRELPPRDGISVADVELRAEGPPLPFGYFDDRLFVRGFWRYTPLEGVEPTPYYLPQALVRVEGQLRDTFFEGNLEVRLALRASHRDPMITADAAGSEPIALPAEIAFGTEMVVRIATFRIFWRRDNFRGARQLDFGEALFPRVRNVYGVRWEFFD